MSRPTFVLGVGAQKAGTTWLYSYLNGHDNANFGFEKEYHVFDYLCDAPSSNHFEQEMTDGQNAISALSKRMIYKDAPGFGVSNNIFKKLDFFYNLNNYFDYFSGIIHRGDNIILSGDITPAYCTLSPEVFDIIRRGFNDRGITVKVIFLMREPVSRVVSACQMALQNNCGALSQHEMNIFAHRVFRNRYYRERTRYQDTIINLESSFSNGELYFGFYERLFSEHETAAICRFLGIEYNRADVGKRENESKLRIEISDSLRKEIRAYYRPVYEFMYARYSRGFMEDIWGGS